MLWPWSPTLASPGIPLELLGGLLLLYTDKKPHVINSFVRWFKTFGGVNIASEKSQRKLADTMLDDTLVSEKVAFSFPVDKGGEEFREVPFLYFPNLIAKVADIVAQHEKYVCSKQ